MRRRPPPFKLETDMTTAIDIRDRLDLLAQERYLAINAGLDHDEAYMADLIDDIATTTAAYIGAAVTEIACLRARMGEPQQG